jgi:hypothetical protein
MLLQIISNQYSQKYLLSILSNEEQYILVLNLHACIKNNAPDPLVDFLGFEDYGCFHFHQDENSFFLPPTPANNFLVDSKSEYCLDFE